jgi:hypothetical protein
MRLNEVDAGIPFHGDNVAKTGRLVT